MLNIAELVGGLDAEIARLQTARDALAALSDGAATDGRTRAGRAARNNSNGHRTMSAAARKRISLAMRKNWNKRKGATLVGSKAPKKAPKKGYTWSPEARARMSERVKKFWKDKKKAKA